MSYLSYLTLLPPMLLGILFTAWLLLPTRKANLLLVTSLGIPIGFGISSCLLFLWFYVFNPNKPGFFFLEFGLIACLAFLLWRQKVVSFQFFTGFLKEKDKVQWILGVISLTIAVIGIATFINYVNINPHGRYDAWAIWNVRARMLARAGEQWKSVFIPQVFHADYPLLLPLTIARSWLQSGTESMRIPSAVAGLFTFTSAGILTGCLITLKRWNQGWLAAIVFLSTPWVIFFGSLQFADIPLAAFILAASACLCLALANVDNPSAWLVLAGLCAGLAGWTKNEGQLFLLMFIMVASGMILTIFHKRHFPGKLLQLGIGLLLPVLVILFFKFTLAPTNDVVNTGDLSPTVTALLSPVRYHEVINGLIAYPKGFGGWSVPIPAIVLSIGLLLWPHIQKERIPSLASISLLLILQWIGYFLIYVITPHQIQVHINQSYDRLLMQLYPTFLLLVFVAIRPIEELFNNIKTNSSPPAV